MTNLSEREEAIVELMDAINAREPNAPDVNLSQVANYVGSDARIKDIMELKYDTLNTDEPVTTEDVLDLWEGV